MSDQRSKQESTSQSIPRLPVHLGGGSHGSRKRGRQRWMILVCLLVGLLLAGGIIWWGPWRQARSAGQHGESDSDFQEVANANRGEHSALYGRGAGMNVLLITLDTTRADHLHCYGHPAIETPHIDALAAGGATCTQCMAPAPITLPSHASMMTGMYPYVHGVRDNTLFRLSESQVTLAEILHGLNYRTGAHVAAFVLNRDCGLAQGFDTYVDTGDAHQRGAEAVSDGAMTWLREHHAERFFLWAHYFDPHAPYDPPEPFSNRYDDPYVAEIAYVDQQVGRLIDEVERLGIRDRTLVVLTADHGEGLGEHEEETHLYFIYNTTMHVPLIFNCPGKIQAGLRVDAQVRLIDVPATILAFLGKYENNAMQGEDLLQLLEGKVEKSDWDAYGETLGGYLAMGLAPLRCIQHGGWKYIHAPRPELYHLINDPGETINLADREPQRREAMLDRLQALISNAPPRSTASAAYRPSDADVQRLMSLGYVGGRDRGSTTGGLLPRETDLFKTSGPDPKDYTEAITLQGNATHALINGESSKAEILFIQLRQHFPKSPGVASRLARALFQQGKDDEAIEVYREIVAEYPDYAEAHYGMAKLMARKKQLNSAISHIRKAIQADPSYPEAHYDLGVYLGQQGDLNASIAAYRRALRFRPNYVDAMINLAVNLVQKKEYEEGIALYRRVIEMEPEDPAVHVNLGNALARQGDYSEAIQCYETALRIKPDFKPAQDSMDTVRRYLEQHP